MHLLGADKKQRCPLRYIFANFTDSVPSLKFGWSSPSRVFKHKCFLIIMLFNKATGWSRGNAHATKHFTCNLLQPNGSLLLHILTKL